MAISVSTIEITLQLEDGSQKFLTQEWNKDVFRVKDDRLELVDMASLQKHDNVLWSVHSAKPKFGMVVDVRRQDIKQAT